MQRALHCLSLSSSPRNLELLLSNKAIATFFPGVQDLGACLLLVSTTLSPRTKLISPDFERLDHALHFQLFRMVRKNLCTSYIRPRAVTTVLHQLCFQDKAATTLTDACGVLDSPFDEMHITSHEVHQAVIARVTAAEHLQKAAAEVAAEIIIDAWRILPPAGSRLHAARRLQLADHDA